MSETHSEPGQKFNPSGLWMPNIELGNNIIYLRIVFLKLKNFKIWYQLYPIHILHSEKEFWKANVLVFNGGLLKVERVWILLVGWGKKEHRYEIDPVINSL